MKFQTKFYVCVAVIAVLFFPSMVMGAAPVPWDSEDYHAHADAYYDCYYGGSGSDLDDVYGPPLPINALASVSGSCPDGYLYGNAASDITDLYMEVATVGYAELWELDGGRADGTATSQFTGTYDADLSLFQFSYSYDYSMNASCYGEYDGSSSNSRITAHLKIDDLTDSVTLFDQTYIDDSVSCPANSSDSGSGTFSVPVIAGHEIAVDFGISGYSSSRGCPDTGDGDANLMLQYDTAETCPDLPVLNPRTGEYYDSLQAAYTDMEDGDVIMSQLALLTEDLIIDRENISVTFKGGYDCDFGTIIGKTRLKGTMTISERAGTVIIEDGVFVLES